MKRTANTLSPFPRQRARLRLDTLEGRLAPGDAMLSQLLGLSVFGDPLVPQAPTPREPAVAASQSLTDATAPLSFLELPTLSSTDLTPPARSETALPAPAVHDQAEPIAEALTSGFTSVFGVSATPGPRRLDTQTDASDPMLVSAAVGAIGVATGASVSQLPEGTNPGLLAPRTTWEDYPQEAFTPAAPAAPAGSPTTATNSIGLDVLFINFSGPNNVNIRFNESLDFGDFGTGLGDLEWLHYIRDLPNTTEIWDTTQSAPAAFVKNSPLTADVLFYVSDPTVDGLVIHAANPGPYGDIDYGYVYVQGGIGYASFSTVGSVGTVDVNDITFGWTLDFVGRASDWQYDGTRVLDTTHRIYTLQNRPVGGMTQPWATVLEVAGGLASDLNTDVAIVQQLTRAIHHSQWRNLRSSAHFIDPQALFIYNPGRAVRSTILPSGPTLSDRFVTQTFNLAGFMSFLGVPETQQQCNDNSNLMTLWLASLGVPMTPLYFARSTSHSPLLNRTTYYPAGSTIQASFTFTFHQINQFGGLVYDVSTRPNVTGDPSMDLTFINYLDRGFPGQTSVGYVTRNVTTITPGNGTGATEFTLTAASPNSAGRGITQRVVLRGAGFDTVLMNSLRAVENGSTIAAAGVTLSNLSLVSSNKIAFDMTVAPTATPRVIQILGTRASAPAWWPTRVNFTLTA